MLGCSSLVVGQAPKSEPTKSGWTSTTLAKQAVPRAIAVTRDGKLSAEVVPDTQAKRPKTAFNTVYIPPDAIVIHDAADRALVSIRGRTPEMMSSQIAFSPDGNMLAIGSIEGNVHLVDVPKLKVVRQFVACKNPLLGLAFAGDEKLAVFDGTDTLSAWDPKTGKKLASLAFDGPAPDKSNSPRQFVVADDKSIFVAKGKDLRRAGFDLPGWDKREVLTERVVALIETPDGKSLILGTDAGKGMIVQDPKIDPKKAFENFKVVTDSDYSISVRDADSLKEVKSFKLGTKTLYFAMNLVPRRNDQVIVEKEGAFEIWDVTSGKSSDSFTHPAPRNTGTFLYSLRPAAGGKLKSYCMEMALGYGPPPIFPARLWTPPVEETKAPR